jgi:hypothetical protein
VLETNHATESIRKARADRARKVELSGPITPGQTYELGITAYHAGQVFTLRAEVR